MDSFEIQWDISGKCPVILLKGDITGDSSEKLQSAYLELKRTVPASTFIFDFNESLYINSSGISSLINILHKHQETNGKFIFTGLSDHMVKVLDIVGLTEYVTICKTLDSAFEIAEK